MGDGWLDYGAISLYESIVKALGQKTKGFVFYDFDRSVILTF